MYPMVPHCEINRGPPLSTPRSFPPNQGLCRLREQSAEKNPFILNRD